MICTGVHSRANLPRYPGQDIFKGEISTGSTYRENTKYSDQKVLVVGEFFFVFFFCISFLKDI